MALYDVSFTVEVSESDMETEIEEAITALFDEELASHRVEGQTRCGVSFKDAVNFQVVEVGA